MQNTALVETTSEEQEAQIDSKFAELLKPAGYRILVRIRPPQETLERYIESRLQMPEEVRERELVGQVWGKVLAVGPDAYQDVKKFPTGPWCQEGDAVVFRSYSGTRVMFEERLYALINDDTVQAVMSPDGTKVIERA
jgi:co-chaperonin GroES (HSP10)